MQYIPKSYLDILAKHDIETAKPINPKKETK